MFLELHKFFNLKVYAAEGEVGIVRDLYFNDEQGVVRYLVMDSSKVLGRPHVLISPIALLDVDFEHKKLQVNLTLSQIQNGPDWPSPFLPSRYDEARYYRYFQWPPYWTIPDLWALGPYGIPWKDYYRYFPSVPLEGARFEHHLDSVRATLGYKFLAEGKELGKIRDLLMDDDTWAINFLKIELAIPHHPMTLIHLAWVREFDPYKGTIAVDLPREKILSSPSAIPSRTRSHEDLGPLYEHYGYSRSWMENPFSRQNLNFPQKTPSPPIERQIRWAKAK